MRSHRPRGSIPRVLLVAPTALDSHGRPIRQSRVFLPGLTLPMLGAVTPPDIDLCTVSDTTTELPLTEHWDLVGVTGMGSGIVRAWQIADAFRARGVPVIQGGIAASLGEPELSLEHVDSVALGECEQLWPVILRDFCRGQLKPVYRNTELPPIAELPVPKYSVMDSWQLGFWRPVQATRGCPFTCTFCSVTSFFRGSYRKAPIPSILRDVRAAKAHGRTRFIAFIDDNLVADPKWALELFEALIPEKIIWMSQASLTIADHPELLAKAAQSGCRLLSFGVESVNPRSLEVINKRFNRPDHYREAFRAIQSHGIDVSTEMIVGFDTDDVSIFDETYKLIMDACITVPRVHIITPIPGTPLHSRLEAEDRILVRDFGSYTGGKVVFRPKQIAPEVLTHEYWRLYERLFTWRAMAHRLKPNHARLSPFMRAFVTGINLHYRARIRERITPGIV